ncbi:hypothetical protein QJQ45_001579 [Haematococcus lacustris]|nr:hypothetical protein QJQ45_001579 [Haematococcus lacustris]
MLSRCTAAGIAADDPSSWPQTQAAQTSSCRCTPEADAQSPSTTMVNGNAQSHQTLAHHAALGVEPVSEAAGGAQLRKVVFLERLAPLMLGGGHIPRLITLAGGSHGLNLPDPAGGQAASPSATTSPQAIAEYDPDLLLLCLDMQTVAGEVARLQGEPWWQDLRAVRSNACFLLPGSAGLEQPGAYWEECRAFLAAVLQDRWELIPPNFPWQLLPPLPPQPDTLPADPACSQDRPQPGSPAAAVAVPMATDTLNTEEQEEEQEAEGVEGEEEGGYGSNPQLAPDVEECYMRAGAAGRSQYTDPVSGYQCFTEEALRSRGTCCSNRCRHCPFGHMRVQRKGPRLNRIRVASCIRSGSSAAPFPAHVTLLAACDGDQGSGLTARIEALLHEAQTPTATLPEVALLVAVDRDSRRIWARTGAGPGPPTGGLDVASVVDPLSQLMDVCLASKVWLVAVPVSRTRAERLLCPSAPPLALHTYVLRAATAALPTGTAVRRLAWVGREELPCFPWLANVGALGSEEAQGGTWPVVADAVGCSTYLE